MIRLIPAVILLLISCNSYSQKFLQSRPGSPLTFPEMQRQFREWKAVNNLKNEKGWKSWKRWEHDMQMHTDGKGNPGDPAIYIQAVTESARQKTHISGSRFTSSAWTPVGPDLIPDNLTGYMENGIGRINCIAFHPTDTQTFFVGVAQGGVWKTMDNGQSYIPLTDDLPILRISDIVIDPSNPDIMYISVCDYAYLGNGLYLNGRKRNTHYGLGVYKTIDGGLTWQPSGLSFLLTDGDASLIKKIVIDPSNTNELAACGVSGMYRSSDAGNTWILVLDTLFWDMVQDPLNPDILYAASGYVKNAQDGYAGIFKSSDFGNTWTLLNTGIVPTGEVMRIKLTISPQNTNKIYAIACDTLSGLFGIYTSINAGITWQFNDPGNLLGYDDESSTGGQGHYDLAFHADLDDADKIFSGGVNVWGSDDGALTFNPASHWTSNYGPSIHADIHFITQHPVTKKYYVCHDGGLNRTDEIIPVSWFDVQSGQNWPTQWENLGNGMAVTSFYRLSSSRNSLGRLVAGSQDNSTIYFNGFSWSTIFGGDGMDNYLDPFLDQNIIGSSQYGNFYKSIDDGFSYSGLSTSWGEPGEWTTPIVADYNNYGTLYTGYINVMKSTDDGDSWTQVSNFNPGIDNEITAMAVAHTDSDVLYVTKRVRYEYGYPGSVFRTTNGGNSWTDIVNNLPDSLYYTSVDISRQDADIVYVTMAGFAAGVKVFRSINGGNSWQNISYNLPNIPVNCLKVIPTTNAVLIGTDIGVYVLDSINNTWISKSLGLPNVIVSDIEFNEDLNKVYVSTFGRGIWETDLDLLSKIEEQIPGDLSVELYPSPNNGMFSINLNGYNADGMSLKINDVMGRMVYSQILDNNNVVQINTRLKPGVYFAVIEGKERRGGVKSFLVR